MNYNDVEKYLEKTITVTGYLIVPNGGDVCFAAWPTCKLWLDNDPSEAGMGLHEAEFTLGDGPNQIDTNGQLRDHNGIAIPITQNEAFSWYHITITGMVSSCKSNNCIIMVSSLKAK